MGISFEGIGQWAATFGCDGEVSEGQVVKVSGGGTVSGCASGDDFCGVAVSVGHDGSACSVALGGLTTVPYTDTAPDLGWTKLAADGNGGVSAGQGRERLVVDVDTAGQTVTFAL
jgi:hypothetical protein